MTITPVTEAQLKAAKVAGLAYLITFAIVVSVFFGINARLIVAGNAAATARNILAHERLFRIGLAGELIYCVGVVVLVAALYVILKPVNQGLALLAAFWRLVWVLIWLVMTLNFFDALRLLHGAGYLQTFQAEQLQSLAKLYLGATSDYYYVGLLFGALASTACACLWFKSRYIPRALAAFGVISSAWCVACTLVFYILPDFDKIVNLWWFDTPMGMFEIALSFLLVFKGLGPSRTAEPTGTSARARAGAA